MWPERVALKHHSRVALVRGEMGHILIAKKNATGIRHIKSRDMAEEGGFSAPTWTQKKKQLTGLDFERNAVEGYHVAEFFDQILDSDRYHDAMGKLSLAPCR
jgi:hypothetical protein